MTGILCLGTEVLLGRDFLTKITDTRGCFVESTCHKFQGDAFDVVVLEADGEAGVFVNLGTLQPPTNLGVIVSEVIERD